jgi:hypothetical protein
MDKKIEKPYSEKVKSFNQYRDQIRTDKLIDKAYKDHLLEQLAEAKQSQPKHDPEVAERLKMIDEKLIPVIKFFTKLDKPVAVVKADPIPAVVTVEKSEDEIQQEIIAKMEAKIKAAAVERLAKKKKAIKGV